MRMHSQNRQVIQERGAGKGGLEMEMFREGNGVKKAEKSQGVRPLP